MATKTQGYILRQLHAGAVIRVEYINEPPSSARKIYRLSDTNEAVRPKTFQQLLADRLIRPLDDGLPGIGEAQTYVLWRASEGGA